MAPGFICGPRIYIYAGWKFEIHSYHGPWPLKQNGDPRKRAGDRFWSMWEKFDTFSDAKKDHYRIGGGYAPIAMEIKEG